MAAPTKPKRTGTARRVRVEMPERLEDIPNIGPRTAADLRGLGIRAPAELAGRDPYALYDELCRRTKQRHDPCVIDAFLSAVRWVEGAPKRPWWAYTAERKRTLAARSR